ncbi:CD160 antigen isoform X3 [Lynx rufus]|uniref:CD160 antigen isoform X3 n=1 Tax=Lynx rufus TaxID=61384 RepID=UPI001F1250F2|nr:CD160 antigen isoform X3 [Lynx rufus]
MLWFSKTIYTSREGVSSDGSGRRPRSKSGAEAPSKCLHQSPRPTSKKEGRQSGGCLHILSSFSQDGKQLSLICTLRHTKEEAEGAIVFLCKDRSSGCFPETSLRQLRLRRDPREDGISERSSQLVFTINHATPSDSGTYQCCATSQRPDMRLQGHFFSVLVTEAGNYTVKGLKQRRHLEFTHSQGTPSSGFLQKVWVMLATSLLALQAL